MLRSNHVVILVKFEHGVMAGWVVLARMLGPPSNIVREVKSLAYESGLLHSKFDSFVFQSILVLFGDGHELVLNSLRKLLTLPYVCFGDVCYSN